MKNLYRLLLFLLLIINYVNAKEVGNKDTLKRFQDNLEYISKMDWIKTSYNAITNIAVKIANEIVQHSYSAIQSFLFNGAFISLLGIIVCIWLFKHLKTGGIPKDEMFKALIWIIVAIFVYVLMSSPAAFNEFRTWILIPQHILINAFSNFSDGGNIGDKLNNVFTQTYRLYLDAYTTGYNYYYNKVFTGGAAVFDFLSPLASYIILLFYTAYMGLTLVLILGISIFNIASSFMMTIFTSFLPLCLPLLLINQTRGHFFAWLKTFIGISFYIPLSLIPLELLNATQKIARVKNGEDLWNNPFYYPFLGCFFGIISIYLLLKIPTWVNQIMGTQESGGGFGIGATSALIGAAGSLAASPARNVGGALLGGAGKGLKGLAKGAGWAAKQAGEATGINAAARGIGSAIGGIGSAIGNKASSLKNSIESGARASGQAISNGVFKAMGKFY